MSPPVAFGRANIPASCQQGKRACSPAITRHRARLAAVIASKSPIFGMLGHILDSLIT
jgi:hypothetical protein